MTRLGIEERPGDRRPGRGAEGEARDPAPASPGVRKRAIAGNRSPQGIGPEGRRRVVAVGTDIGMVNLFNVRSCGVFRRQDVLISSC